MHLVFDLGIDGFKVLVKRIVADSLRRFHSPNKSTNIHFEPKNNQHRHNITLFGIVRCYDGADSCS